MFEDQNKPIQSDSRVEPKQPDDMFAGIDTGRPPSIPTQMQNQVNQGVRVIQEKPGIGKNILLILVLIVAVLILAGFGIWFLFLRTVPLDVNQVENFTNMDNSLTNTTNQINDTNSVDTTNQNEENVTGQGSQSTEVPAVPEVTAPIDTDGDGLSDVQEISQGMNPNSPDTDGDGLFDKEEVDVYHTDPLNPDTDGDTFGDGTEVRNGYNPNGSGRLFQVPR